MDLNLQNGIDKQMGSVYNVQYQTLKSTSLTDLLVHSLSSMESGEVRDCLSTVGC